MPDHRPSWVDDRLFPFRSRFVQIEGHRVHYVDEGSGPTLLMLHGNPTWSFVYREVITALSDQFRCIACDYPGFGLSVAAPGYGYLPAQHAAVVSALVTHLDLTEVTLVAQDWGGPIGLSTVLADPDRFSALVIANTWAWPVNGDRHFEIFSRLLGGPLGRAAIRRLNVFVNLLIPAGHVRRKISAGEMSHYRNALPIPERRQASAVFPRQILASREFLAGIDARLPEIAHLPALIVWATGDRGFRAQERQGWERRLPNHTTVILNRTGHYLQSDAPGEFAAAIRDWHPHTADRHPDASVH